MSVFYSPVFQETQFKSDGTLAVGYKIYTYAEGSSTPLTTYTTSLGNVAQANPINGAGGLNARGEPNNPIWLTGGLGYKFVFTTDADVLIRTIDNVRGVGDTTSTSGQYVTFGGTATYISATSFSLVGDQTSPFEVGRAVKLLTSGGTVYAKILTSAFTTLTTITINQASGALDTGLTGTSPAYGLISQNNNALPASTLKTATGSFTRVMTAASANVAVTGVGFKPKRVRFYMANSTPAATPHWSIGEDNGAFATCIFDTNQALAGSMSIDLNGSIRAQGTTGTQIGRVLTMDADGFTIAWTLSSTGAGITGTISYFAET
jgi:hypothetical protein